MKINNKIALLSLIALIGCDAPQEELGTNIDVVEFRSSHGPSLGCEAPHAGNISGTVMVNGVSRPYRVEVPPTWDGTIPIPIAYTFHACGSDYLNAGWTNLYMAAGQTQWLADDLEQQLGSTWQNVGFPNGTYPIIMVSGDSLGTCWDVSPNAWDLPYYDAVRQAVESYYCVDGDRRYHAGVSSGGFAAQAYACRRDGVAAVFSGLGGMHHPNPAPYGLTPTPLPEPEECNGPVNVFGMASTNDTLVSPNVYTRPARDTWLEINGCDPNSGVPYVHRVPRADPQAGGAPNGNACTTHTNCGCLEYTCTGARTVWCEYTGLLANGHDWPAWPRDAAVNWFGRFADEAPIEEESSSGEPASSSGPNSSSTTDEPSTTH